MAYRGKRKRIIGVEYYQPFGCINKVGVYAAEATLECGHKVHYKKSKLPKKGRVECYWCNKDAWVAKLAAEADKVALAVTE